MTEPSFLEESVKRVDVLQVAVWEAVNHGIAGDPSEAMLEYYHLMYALMVNQGSLYTRLQLMSEPKYTGIQVGIHTFCCDLGMEPTMPVMEYHYKMKRDCLLGIAAITGESVEDLESLSNLDLDDLDF